MTFNMFIDIKPSKCIFANMYIYTHILYDMHLSIYWSSFISNNKIRPSFWYIFNPFSPLSQKGIILLNKPKKLSFPSYKSLWSHASNYLKLVSLVLTMYVWLLSFWLSKAHPPGIYYLLLLYLDIRSQNTTMLLSRGMSLLKIYSKAFCISFQYSWPSQNIW